MADTFTKLLLHMNVVDASAAFTDSSFYARTVTRFGNAQIDTAQSVFGGASGLFDGTGDYLSTPDSTDFNFGTSDYTLDFRVRFAALPTNGNYVSFYDQSNDANNYVAFYLYNDAGVYTLEAYVYVAGVEQIYVADTWTPVINTWYHVAFVRSGTSFMTFVDGTQLGTTDTDTYSIPDFTGSVLISESFGPLNGWLDEYRLSIGIARWIANFIPPTKQYGDTMPNNTFGDMKIKALRRWGNNYNANDATRLELAGSCINQALGIIQGEIKGHPYTLDINNQVTCTITSPYGTLLSDTDIIEILQVSQRSDPRKLKWIPYPTYMEYMADPTRWSGTPNLFWTAVQSVSGGINVWTLFFIPTPGTAITIYYDYVKSLQFTSDGTSADSSYCALPNTFEGWIYAEAKPLFYEIIAPMEGEMITRAHAEAADARQRYKTMILSGANTYVQVQSVRERGPYVMKQVQTVTP